jgi:hypothetical protein
VRSHLRDNVVGYVALFCALSAGAYAAATLPKNSVGTKQLRENAVIGSKVAGGSLTGADIREATLGLVPKAATLKGTGPSGFVKGHARIIARRVVTSPTDTSKLVSIPGLGRLDVTCDVNGAESDLSYTNTTGSTETVWIVGATQFAPGSGPTLIKPSSSPASFTVRIAVNSLSSPQASVQIGTRSDGECADNAIALVVR